MDKGDITNPFDGNELMELLRGLEDRKIAYQIEYRRAATHCDGIMVRIRSGLEVWEVGFFDNDHVEVLKFTSSKDVEAGVTAASLLSDLDALENSK